MEVHHHHAHESHGKKTWKAYFWEFLMLFLAVFCGFLAEYKLEHVIEHQREKQYVESLIADLKNDQEIISVHSISVKSSMLMMDSLISLLSDVSAIDQHTGQIYYLARMAPRLSKLTLNSRTYEQLKYSGNFRLIHDLKISNRIMNYYSKFPFFGFMEGNHETEFTEYKKVAARVCTASVLKSMETDNDEIRRIDFNPPLISNDKMTLQEMAFFGVQMSGTKKSILYVEKELKKNGEELISYLKEEYHLDD